MKDIGIGSSTGGGFEQSYGQQAFTETQNAQKELLNLASLYKTQLCNHFEKTG